MARSRGPRSETGQGPRKCSLKRLSWRPSLALTHPARFWFHSVHCNEYLSSLCCVPPAGFPKGKCTCSQSPPRLLLRIRALPVCGPLGTSSLTPVHTVGLSVLSTLASLCAPTPARVPWHTCFLTGHSHRVALASSSGW